MESSQARALTTSRQLAVLRLHRFSSGGSAMTRLAGQVTRAIESHPGRPMGTEGIGAATLAWEMAMLAQSCAYLAEEAQLWAQNSVDRTLTSPDLIYRQLNVHLAEEIRYMLGLGLATIMVECMTSTESQETSSTVDAGDTK
jgi:hypothetical protein